MSLPIDYQGALQLFSAAQEKGCYIDKSLELTKNLDECATPDITCSLAKIALAGLEKQLKEKSESLEKLQLNTQSIKNYVAKIKASPALLVTTNQIFLKLFAKTEREINQLKEMEELFIGEQELRTFPDKKLHQILITELDLDLHKYGIKSQRTLIRLAKIGAGDGYGYTMKDIQKFGIKKQSELMEIAKIAISHHGFASQYIRSFGFTDQKFLVELAKIAATKFASGLCGYIQNYGITDKNDLFEIAKLAVVQSNSASAYIKSFGITDQRALIEIAKLAAVKHGNIGKYIQNYRIADQQALIKIAMLAARQNGANTSQYIQNYGITDPEALIQIAKLAAQQNGLVTSREIKNYKIEKQSALIEIANLAINQDTQTSRYIHSYEIKDEMALINLAKLVARLDGRQVNYNIKSFGITNEKALIEIAKITAQNNPWETSAYIEDYGIENKTGLLEIFIIALNNDHDILPDNYLNYQLPYPLQKLSKKSTLSEIQKFFKWPDEFSQLFKEISQKTLSEDDAIFLITLGCKLLNCKFSPLNNGNLWLTIYHYGDQKMRYELINAAFALNESQAKRFEIFASQSYLQLPALFLCCSSKDDKEAQAYFSLLQEKKVFRDALLIKPLLDVLHPLIMRYNFEALEISDILTSALKGNIKSNLFAVQGALNCGGEDFLRKEAQRDNPDLHAVYQATFAQTIPIEHIKDFSAKYEQSFGSSALPTAPLTYAGRLNQLPEIEKRNALSLLATFIQSVLEGYYPKNRYEKSEHLEKIFAKKPSLRETWHVNDESPLEDCLSATTSESSFDPKKFLKEKILNDKHLHQGKYAELYRFLGAKEEKAAEEIVVGLTNALKELAISTKETASQKKSLLDVLGMINDIEKGKITKSGAQLRILKKAAKKLQNSTDPDISKILKSINDFVSSPSSKPSKTDDTQRTQIIQTFISQLKKTASGAHHKLAMPDELQQRLQLQKDLMDLCKNEKKPLLIQLNLLKKIQEGLVDSREEFLNDINGLVEALEKQKQPFDGYKLVNTDRFDFMLLSGTQVQGSCQRIDGEPSLNKCLLAYLLDGKIRMLAVKDKDDKIVARSILRLLWDAKSGSPVLMQERAYSNVMDASLIAALDLFALKQAEKLGIDIYKADDSGTAELDSFGSISPWEYVDSAKGTEDKGIYRITAATRMAKNCLLQ